MNQVSAAVERGLHKAGQPVNEALQKTNKMIDQAGKTVRQTGKDVSAAVKSNLKVEEPKTTSTQQLAIAVPVVLVVLAGFYLWKTKPWAKRGPKTE